MRWIPAIAASIVLVLTGACGEGETDRAQSIAQGTQAPATGAVESRGTTSAATATAEPTRTPSPTPVPTPSAAPTKPIAIVVQGFGAGTGLGSRSVGYAFIIENPNEGQAAERVQYQVAAYDAAGIVLKTDQGSNPVVWPKERLGIGGSLFLSEGQQVARIDVQVKADRFVPVGTPVPFTTEGVAYRGDRFSSKVVGVVRSPATRDLKSLRVSAVAYDAQDNIIGGGFTFLDFVPANGQAAVEVSINASGPPARVELYPALSNLSLN